MIILVVGGVFIGIIISMVELTNRIMISKSEDGSTALINDKLQEISSKL